MPGDDKKPSSRFDMIAEEMTTEPEMTVVEDLRPVWNGEAIACPQCGNSAFEPLPPTLVSGRPRATCLGCPPPAPVFGLPEGLKLSTNRYRCGSCGRQSQVTMTLSDVNLHCRGCSRLTLHQRVARPSLGDAARRAQQAGEVSYSEYARVKVKQSSKGWLAELMGEDVAAEPESGLVQELTRQGFLEEGGLVDVLVRAGAGEAGQMVENLRRMITLDPAPAQDGEVAAVIENMRRMLGLDDFAVFEQRVRELNMKASLRAEDLCRRTGRTTRGILDALARCSLLRANTLLVCGVSPRHEKDLRQVALAMRSQLKLGYPAEVKPIPSGPDAALIGQIYVDHSYWDSDRRLMGLGDASRQLREKARTDDLRADATRLVSTPLSVGGRSMGSTAITAITATYGDRVVGIVADLDVRSPQSAVISAFTATFKLLSEWLPQLQDRLTLVVAGERRNARIDVMVVGMRRIATAGRVHTHEINAVIDSDPGAVADMLLSALK